MQDEQMIEALTPYTAKEPLTDGIGTWGVIRSFENLDVTRMRNPSECKFNISFAVMAKHALLFSKAKLSLRIVALLHSSLDTFLFL